MKRWIVIYFPYPCVVLSVVLGIIFNSATISIFGYLATALLMMIMNEAID